MLTEFARNNDAMLILMNDLDELAVTDFTEAPMTITFEVAEPIDKQLTGGMSISIGQLLPPYNMISKIEDYATFEQFKKNYLEYLKTNSSVTRTLYTLLGYLSLNVNVILLFRKDDDLSLKETFSTFVRSVLSDTFNLNNVMITKKGTEMYPLNPIPSATLLQGAVECEAISFRELMILGSIYGYPSCISLANDVLDYQETGEVFEFDL